MIVGAFVWFCPCMCALNAVYRMILVIYAQLFHQLNELFLRRRAFLWHHLAVFMLLDSTQYHQVAPACMAQGLANLGTGATRTSLDRKATLLAGESCTASNSKVNTTSMYPYKQSDRSEGLVSPFRFAAL